MSRRHKVPSKLGKSFGKSKAGALPSEVEADVPGEDKKDIIMDMLNTMIGEDANEYAEYLTENDADAIWEMVGMMPNKSKVIEYLDVLKNRGIDETEEVPYYQSSVFLSPDMYGLIEMAEARKNALLRTDVYKEGPVNCGKCGSNYLSAISFNNRAFDEPQTTRYTCGQCKNTWFI